MKMQVVRAYWPSFRVHWFWWMVALLGMTVSVSLQSISPHYLRGIVDTFTSEAPDLVLAKSLFLEMLLVIAGIIVAYRFMDLGMVLHEARAMQDLDNRSFRAMQRQSLRFFEDTPHGSLITQARRFRASYEQIIDLFFFQFGKNSVMIVAIAIALGRALPAVTVPFLIWMALFIAYSVVTTWWKYSYDRTLSETDSKVSAALADTLSNQHTVKTFGREAAEERRFAVAVQANHTARLWAWMISNLVLIGQAVLMSAGELLLIWWMIRGWEHGRVTAGDFVFVQTFVVWAITNFWPFGHSLRRLFTHVAEAEEMAAVFALTPEVRDAAGARPLIVEDGEVEFHAVCFSYGKRAEGHAPALNDFSLTIPAGQRVGLVGRSGAGKTTAVKLLLRFYEPHSGRIRIDRQDIANVAQVSLRQQLAVVPQHPQLFHRSVRENITFAAPDATEAEVIAAARQAHAWEFIERLPDGLDSLVGEQGVKLSGGQQQRIAIARAILADPRVLVLDEATSALDSATEKLIQKAIANLLRGRTAIVIAHRLSTIMRLDRIVVMEAGEIIEIGTHDELLALDGMYADLWSHQSGGYIN